jgi:hypothetical protein
VLWVLLDVLIGLSALVLLGFAVLGLWRKVKDLGREVGRAGDSVGRVTDELARLSEENPRSLGSTDTGGRRA